MDRRQFLKSGAALAGLAAPAQILSALQPVGAGRDPLAASQDQGAMATEALLDLRPAVIVAPPELSRREQKAIIMLAEEVEKRTGTRWPTVLAPPPSAPVMVVAGSAAALEGLRPSLPTAVFAGHENAGREGFTLRVSSEAGRTVVSVFGADERGVLFGIGRLLRALRMTKGQVRLPDSLSFLETPKYRLRGHQLGYRPKTNSYDGWTVPMWEQYIRDLAVFGTNAIELIPPRSDDEPQSPHFPLPPLPMMTEMSRLADEYGLDVWIWYPAMDRDYSDPETIAFATEEWGEIFKVLPRVDAVFVPGGDPGHTRPTVLLGLLERQTENLHRYHPQASMWVSPQSFNQEWLDEFLTALQHDQPPWLGGVVFGPQTRVSLPALRERVPERYPIRFYPDITHSLECQFPVPDWDSAFALTEGREGINPRPLGESNIFTLYAGHSLGFITYSEGCNDDVNKIVWSALGWDPNAKVIEVLRDYSRYFLGERYTDDFAQGVLSLERNWQGPLLSNEDVDATLRQFQAMESSASPPDLLNWRFQQGLYRAYYDAYVRSRLLRETALESEAMHKLEEMRRVGSTPTAADVMPEAAEWYSAGPDPATILSEAERILDLAMTAPSAEDWRTRILELGEALYQSIRMQLSVERYKAEAVSRGANLDTLDAPLTSAPWLKRRFAEIRKLASREAQARAIQEILERTNPGPGGFYDDLGDLSRQPHLVRGLGGALDPEFRASSLVGFDYPDLLGANGPVSWKRWAESLFDAPLTMRYSNLDPEARYKVRVVYAGDSPGRKIRLAAGNLEVHPLMSKPWPPRPLEFDVPREATSAGELVLEWRSQPGLGGNGRGCQVTEVWLIKK